MKYLAIALVFFSAEASLGLALAGRETPAANSTAQTTTFCGDPATTIPIYRAYNGVGYNHLYSTSATEIENVVESGAYAYEGIAGRLFATQVPGTIPFYRFYSGAPRIDHFYTTNKSEGINAAGNYNLESILGYVYQGTECGGSPFYRMFLPDPKTDHFYTMGYPEVLHAETVGGYTFEGIAAYIFLA